MSILAPQWSIFLAANGGSVPVLPDIAPQSRGNAARWSDLRKRVLSATILAPAVLLCIWAGGVPFKVMLVAAALGLAWEWIGLCGTSPTQMPGKMVAVAVVAGTFSAAMGYFGSGLAIFATGAVFTAAMAGGTPHWRALAAGIPYAGIGAIALLWLRDDPASGLENLLFVLLLVWASDIGAYMTGRFLGGPKLAPRISPGKTWSGALGGLAAAIGAGLLVAFLSHTFSQPLRVAAIAGCLGIVAQAGDLLESLLKRHFGAKDSGNLIPGHGGLLDRLDALLIAAPVAALLALIAGRGVMLWQ
jgi:phosphatidate cytidylyltransferase